MGNPSISCNKIWEDKYTVMVRQRVCTLARISDPGKRKCVMKKGHTVSLFNVLMSACQVKVLADDSEVTTVLYRSFRLFLCCSGDSMTNCTNSQCNYGLKVSFSVRRIEQSSNASYESRQSREGPLSICQCRQQSIFRMDPQTWKS